jgi:hypothetical protein
LFWILENIGFWFDWNRSSFAKVLKETNFKIEKEKGHNKKKGKKAWGVPSGPAPEEAHGPVIRLQRIYNFLCSMLVFTPFAYCFDTISGTFMHFSELTY